MKARALIATAAMALAATALPSLSSAQPQGQAAQRDWTRTVVATPEGGFRMGNPEAPVQLVEFVSLTCPHCADFAEEGVPRLIADHVRTGRVSLEYRNFALNGLDAAAAVLSRCAGPASYFALSHDILKAQPQWVGRFEAMTEAQRAAFRGLDTAEAGLRLGAITGLAAIARRHGLTDAQLRACYGNPASFEALDRLGQAAQAAGVSGTPTFAINGRLLDGVHDWAALEPRLLQGR